MTTLTDDGSQNFTYGYDIANKLISKALPNGVNTTYEYDGMSLLTRLKDVNTSATLFDRQYGYNPANQIAQITEPARSRVIGYDNIDRLTSVTDATNGNESYTFNSVGKRTASHLSSTYSYQPFNKLTATQTSTQSYDPNGNMVQKSEGSNFWRYTWDYENRLGQASTRKQSVRYKYDALGRRVSRSFVGNRENTKFIYDGLDVIMDDDANAGITRYQNGPGIDNKLSFKNGADVKYFLTDHLGSTNGLADASGAVTSSASYDSFGNQTGTLPTRYGFTGRECDDFTGLMYYRARFYDPKLGRFISEDPIGFYGGDINLYGYVGNKSINRKDPTGLDDADIAYRDTDYYRDLERRGNEYWKSVRNSPKRPECGPASSPVVEWLVPDHIGGPFTPVHSISPACESHDSCYSTCGMPKGQCDTQLGQDVTSTCLLGGGSVSECTFYGNGYYQGVSRYGGGAYQSAQEESGCVACTLLLSPPPPDPCSNFGDWRCK